MPLKVGIVGSGFVGSAAAYALLLRGVGREIVLVDQNARRAEAEANDILHAVPFASPLRVSSGGYEALQGSRVVVVAAGVNQKPGETRLQLLERNAAVFRDVIPGVVRHAPDAVLLVATNPVDVMTHVAAHYSRQAGVPTRRVLGSGTTLDTARFRALLSNHFGVDARHVHGYVLGEHGDSEVLTWSLASIGGLHLDEFARFQNVPFDDAVRQRIDQGVRRAAYQIIESKGATYFGIGAALARIADVILHDQRAILSVCTHLDDVAGLSDVTLSLPNLVGGDGTLGSVPVVLSPSEQESLHASADVIRRATASLAGKL